MVSDSFLLKNENALETILRTIPDLLFHIDKTGRFLSYFQPEDYTMPAFIAGDFIGRTANELFDEVLSSKFMNSLSAALSEGLAEFEYSSLKEVGNYFSFILSKIDENELICMIRDISVQKETELSLIVSETRYREILDKIGEVIYEIDEKGKINYISPSVKKLTGYSPSEITGLYFTSFVGENEEFLKMKMDLIRSNKELTNEYRISNKNGEVRWIRLSTKALFSDGKFMGGTGTLFDITEYKLAEEQLMKNEEMYRILAENITDIIFVIDLKNEKFRYFSPSAYQLTGYTVEEVMRQNINTSIIFESATELTSKWTLRSKDFISNPSLAKTYADQFRIKSKDGRFTWVEANSHFQFDENGDVEILGVCRNIERQKLAELRLQEYADELAISEEKFSSVFNQNPVLMVINNFQTRFIEDANQAFLNKFKFDKKDIIGKPAREINIFLDDQQRQVLGSALTDGELVINFETSLKNKYGEIFDIILSSDHVVTRGSEYLMSTGIDITQLREHENKLKYLHNNQKILTNISQALSGQIDTETSLEHILKFIGTQKGLSRVYIFEQIQNFSSSLNYMEWCKDGIAPRKEYLKDLSLLEDQSVKKMLLLKGCIVSENISQLPADIFNLLELHNIKSISIFPLISDNQYIGFIGFDDCEKKMPWFKEDVELYKTISTLFSNAFERKRGLEILRQNELSLKMALEVANEGIWEWNLAKGTIELNDICYRMLGYETSEIELLRPLYRETIHPDDLILHNETISNFIHSDNEYYESTFRLRKKDGSWLWVLDHGVSVERNSENRPVKLIGTRIDISSQKETENKLNQMLKIQERLFLVISRNLRGPIGSLGQGLNILTDNRYADIISEQLLINELQKASKSTYNLLENLLIWSRMQTNTLILNPEPCLVSQIIDEVIYSFHESFEHKNIKKVFEPGEQLIALADRNSLNLILMNLISNAIKFTRDNGAVEIYAYVSDANVKIEVSNNGTGIKKELLDIAFQTSENESPGETDVDKGPGIGLTICRNLIEKNGGTIEVENEPAKGSTFTITLPKTSFPKGN